MALDMRIDGRDYAMGLAKRFGIFIGITLAFPLFVYAMIGATGAGGVGGASGALALVLGVYLKPVIYLCFAYSTLRISIRRARTVGLSPAVGLAVPALVLADLSFGITFGSFWAVGFALGILSLAFPASLCAAVIAAGILSLLPDDMDEQPDGRTGNLYGIWKVLLVILIVLGVIRIFPFVSAWILGASGMGLSIALLQAVSYLKAAFIYPHGLLVAFTIASVALVRASGKPLSGDGGRMARQDRGRAPMFGNRRG